MNTAMILAAGTGQRMGGDVPKQFIEVMGKPVIAHTLEIYQRRDDFEVIQVVCVEGYESLVWHIAKEYQANAKQGRGI